MNKRRKARDLVLLFLAVAIIAATSGAKPPAAGPLTISVPRVRLAPGERVVGFDFKVISGRIVQVRDMPIGWNISVNNDPSWVAKIDGSIIVAAAAVAPSFFTNFLVIEKDPHPLDPFDVRGEVIVSKDFSKTRSIPLRMGDFVFRAALQR